MIQGNHRIEALTIYAKADLFDTARATNIAEMKRLNSLKS